MSDQITDVLVCVRRVVGVAPNREAVLDVAVVDKDGANASRYKAAVVVVVTALLGCAPEKARTSDRNDAVANAVEVVNALVRGGFLATQEWRR